ncbi:helix-turn-helix domain-containing protein [Labilibacter marinus]|uniref:helix-turn-helix domain-containing protein n=1 Tax=Labilibacter marinus TaxID=1477105 RepID=UPI0009F8C78C
MQLHPSVETAYLKLNNQENYPAILEYNLDDLAQECHLSPVRLSRLFHAQIGTTLILYRNQKRLEYFQQIYSSSPHLTISEAAFSAGFGSYAQFQKSFIKAFGYSPKSFKDKVRR